MNKFLKLSMMAVLFLGNMAFLSSDALAGKKEDQKIAELQQQNAELQGQLSELKEEATTFKQFRQHKEDAIRIVISEKDAKIAELSAQNSSLQEKNAELQGRLNTLQEEIGGLKNAIEESDKTIAELRAQNSSLVGQVGGFEQSQSDYQTLQAEMNSTQVQIAELNAKNQELEAQLLQLNNVNNTLSQAKASDNGQMNYDQLSSEELWVLWQKACKLMTMKCLSNCMGEERTNQTVKNQEQSINEYY